MKNIALNSSSSFPFDLLFAVLYRRGFCGKSDWHSEDDLNEARIVIEEITAKKIFDDSQHESKIIHEKSFYNSAEHNPRVIQRFIHANVDEAGEIKIT